MFHLSINTGHASLAVHQVLAWHLKESPGRYDDDTNNNENNNHLQERKSFGR
ncbi:hypothetical protein KAZ93_02800 [Patescibacteria group bacterium]|nr:hypothetical protein [Patescibacteria group bacterium]